MRKRFGRAQLRASAGWLAAVAALLLFVACHPYGDSLTGEFNAGSADPFNFPPAYRSSTGAGFSRQIAGSGSFTERRAFARGVASNYFFFPFPPTFVGTTGYAQPAAVVDSVRIGGPSSLPVPLAFQIDPTDPVQDTSNCTPPPNYQYDVFRDDVRYDRQGNLATVLPNANFGIGALPTWSYVPVVQRVPVASNGEPCQGVISDLTILKRPDVSVPVNPDATPKPDPVFLAWAIIDPGSPVFRVGQTSANATGVGVQHWGWYRQFLIAYLDAGPIPTVDVTVGTASVKRMVPQRLYFPRSVNGAAAAIGAGNDVVQGVRGDPPCTPTTPITTACYSPVCQVFSYVLPGAAATNPKDVATIEASFGAGGTNTVQAGAPTTATGTITPTFVFCLQAQ